MLSHFRTSHLLSTSCHSSSQSRFWRFCGAFIKSTTSSVSSSLIPSGYFIARIICFPCPLAQSYLVSLAACCKNSILHAADRSRLHTFYKVLPFHDSLQGLFLAFFRLHSLGHRSIAINQSQFKFDLRARMSFLPP